MASIDDLLVDFLTNDRLHVPNNSTAQSERESLLAQISDEMDSPESPVSLPDLIEMLEPSLTSAHEGERYRGTLLLAELLKKKSNALLTSEGVSSSAAVLHLFVVFFARRLSDAPSMAPALQALCELFTTHRTQLDAKYLDALDVALSLTQDVHLPAYAQNVRQQAWELFTALLEDERSIEALSVRGREIVDGIINAMESEKDPRCLRLVLLVLARASRLFTAILLESPPTSEEDYATLAEKVFDGISCYFPISFTPPPNDPFGVTPASLRTALQEALCGASPVVRHTLPFLVEQLEGEMETESERESESLALAAKRDALHALARIVNETANNYGNNRKTAENINMTNDGTTTSDGSVNADLGGYDGLAMLRGNARELRDSLSLSRSHTQTHTSSTPYASLLTSTHHTPSHTHTHAEEENDDDDEERRSYLHRLSDALFSLCLSLSPAEEREKTSNEEVHGGAPTESEEVRDALYALVAAITYRVSTGLLPAPVGSHSSNNTPSTTSNGTPEASSFSTASNTSSSVVVSTAEVHTHTHTVSSESVSESDWRVFHENLLRRALRELSVSHAHKRGPHTHAHTLRARLAWKLCMVVGTSGGCVVSARVVRALSPQVLPLVTETLTRTHAQLTRYAQAVEQRISVRLLTLTDSLSHTQAEDASHLSPAALAMLQSLVCCALPLSVCVSQLRSLNPLREREREIFTLLFAFLHPPQTRLTHTQTQDKMDVEEGQDLAHSAKPRESTPSHVSNTLSPEAVAATVCAVQAMKTLLYRSQGRGMGLTDDYLATTQGCATVHPIDRYLNRVTEVLCHGWKAVLFCTDEKDTEGMEGGDNADNGWLDMLDADLAQDSHELQRACADLLLQLTELPLTHDTHTEDEKTWCFHTTLREKIFPTLLSVVLRPPSARTHTDTKRERVSALLSSLIKKSAAHTQELLSLLTAQLSPVLVRETHTLLRALSVESDAQLALRTLQHVKSLIELVAHTLSEDAADETANHTRAVFLSGVGADVAVSPLITIVNVLNSLSTQWQALSQGSKEIASLALACKSSVLSLLSRTIGLLSVSEQQIFLSAALTTLPSVQQLCQEGDDIDHSLSLELALHLLMNLDKQCSFFSVSNAHGVFSSSSLFTALLSRWGKTDSTENADIIAQILAIIVNKVSDVTVLSSLLAIALSATQGSLLSHAQRAATLLCWILKALSLRPTVALAQGEREQHAPHTSWQSVWLSLYLSHLLAQETFSLLFAEKIDTLLCEPLPQSALCKSSRGHVALLWQQKLFTQLFSALQREVRTLSPSIQAQTHTLSSSLSLLFSIAKVVESVSPALRKANCDVFVHSLVFSLSLLQSHHTQQSEESVCVSEEALARVEAESVAAVSLLLKEHPAVFIDHLHVVIPRLLKTAQCAPAAKQRYAALESLQQLPQHVTYSRLHPHRKAVLAGLQNILDDKKRAVRQLAATVRNEWVLFE